MHPTVDQQGLTDDRLRLTGCRPFYLATQVRDDIGAHQLLQLREAKQRFAQRISGVGLERVLTGGRFVRLRREHLRGQVSALRGEQHLPLVRVRLDVEGLPSRPVCIGGDREDALVEFLPQALQRGNIDQGSYLLHCHDGVKNIHFQVHHRGQMLGFQLCFDLLPEQPGELDVPGEIPGYFLEGVRLDLPANPLRHRVPEPTLGDVRQAHLMLVCVIQQEVPDDHVTVRCRGDLPAVALSYRTEI